ncbi:MAG: NAD-binding protein, partial [Armatimonadetes bacterium]|nr:NAD-binding protein [Armatimonadota bacterium]
STLRGPIVVLSDDVPDEIRAKRRVIFVKGDPTKDSDLQRAGIASAKTAMILATDFCDPQTSDSRALMTALAVEGVNPRVYTVVEIVNPDNARHFAHAHVDEIICCTDLGAKIAV